MLNTAAIVFLSVGIRVRNRSQSFSYDPNDHGGAYSPGKANHHLLYVIKKKYSYDLQKTHPEPRAEKELANIETGVSHSDPTIVISSFGKPSLKEYVRYAAAQRQADREHDGSIKWGIGEKLQSLASTSLPKPLASDRTPNHSTHDHQTEGLSSSEIERVNAWRALRIASWPSAWFLCTTDILGPFNAPYAFRQNGYVAGTLLYVFMGGMAFYGGALVWWLYVKLDSDRYPVKSYSHLADRIVGSWLRVLVTWLIFIHMIVNVGTTSLGNAQSLYQLVNGRICFVVAIVIWIAVGIILNQIRTLKRYSLLSTLAITLNVLVIFLSMGFISHSLPNYTSAHAAYGIPAPAPVKTQLFATYPFYERINGVMNIAYAYGGATIFAQIIAEMRRPMDFLKAFTLAQALIFVLYTLYGLFVYSYQGQFTLPVAFQGVSKKAWQDIGNIITLISSVIAGGLYGNIGLKVVYINVIEDYFHGPNLLSVRGHFIWSGLVVLFWVCGFIVAAAVPQVQTLSGMVAAVANVQFTYSFPTGFTFLYLVRLHGAETGVEGWRSWRKWKAALFGGSTSMILFKWFNFLVSLASFATAGLGIYGSGLSIHAAFKTAAATSFGCAAPV